MFKSIEIGTVFLDSELRIRKFTPEIKHHFNLLEKDIDRPIEIFSTYLSNANIKEDALAVLRTGEHFEKEIQNNEGVWFLQRIMPFIDAYDEVKGVVISFVDITKTKVAELQYRNIFNLTALPLWEEDYSGVIEELDKLKGKQIIDIVDYLNEHPNFVKKCIASIKVKQLNPAAKKLMNASSSKEVNSLNFREENDLKSFVKEIAMIYNGGGVYVSAERVIKTKNDDAKNVIIYINFPKNRKDLQKYHSFGRRYNRATVGEKRS